MTLLPQLPVQLRTPPGWMRLGQRLQSLLNAGVIPRPASPHPPLRSSRLLRNTTGPSLTDLLLLNRPTHRRSALLGRQNFFVSISLRIE
jgi:hypothetical protein